MKCLRAWIFALLVLLPACSDDNGARPTPDITPPATVQNLTVQDSTGNTVTLGWTAPGDDGAEGRAALYDIRYSMSLLTEAGWDSARIVDPLLVPKAAGEVESLSVSGLSDGCWYFGLKAVDEMPNWSALSNVVSATLLDTIPPGQVTDLAAGLATMASMELIWTSPGDDGGEGEASEYDMRYALTPITEETWGDALRLEGMPAPGSAGSRESYTITGLEPGTTYSFALKSVDDVLIWSELSNVVGRSTAYVVRLTYSPDGHVYSGARSPAWSPDGQNILFHATWGEWYYQTQLYLIPASGGDPVRLTSEPFTVGSSCWSPDGTQVAFTSSRIVDDIARDPEIFIMDAVPGSQGVQVSSFQSTRNPSGLTWSPDACYFAFIHHRHWPSPIAELCIMPSTGGTSQLVIRSDGLAGRPDWSPDGTRVAFTDYRNEYQDIWVIPVFGGPPAKLTNDPARDYLPAWSPDGSRIAFQSDRGGSYDIWLMSSAGESPTQLTYDLGARSPSWSPDGSRIAFSARHGENEISDILVLVLE